MHTHKSLFLVAIFLVSSCGIKPSGTPKTNKELDAGNGSGTDSSDQCSDKSTDTNGTSQSVVLIVTSKCQGCHSVGQSPPLLQTESDITSAKTSVVSTITNGSMPPGAPLEESQVSVFRDWQKESLDLAAEETPTDYAHLIRPLFNTKCTFCHSKTGIKPKDPYLDTYTLARKKASGSLEEMEDGEMPERNDYVQVNSSDAVFLKDWIDAGMPEGTKPTFPTKIEFTTHVKPFIDGNCIGCHNTGNIAPDLSTEEKVKMVSGSILNDLKNKSMPPGGLIYDTEIEMFRTWNKQLDDELAKNLGSGGSNQSVECP